MVVYDTVTQEDHYISRNPTVEALTSLAKAMEPERGK
jgi:hypothetical protein